MIEQSLNFIVMIVVKKELSDDIYDIIKNFVETIKHEDGCLNCECLQPVGNKSIFLFQESWTSIDKATEQITQLHVDYLSAMTGGDFFNKNFEVSTWLLISDNKPCFDKNDNMFSFLLNKKAKKTKGKELRNFLEKIIDISMIETDCLSYCLYINSVNNNDGYLMIGTWTSKKMWQKHHRSQYMQNFVFREGQALITNTGKPLLQEVKKIL